MKKTQKSKKNGSVTIPTKLDDTYTKAFIIDFGTYQDGYEAGLKTAAEYIQQFDKYVNHDWRLSDCLLAKFGRLKKSKVRKNKRSHILVGIWNTK